MLLNAHLPKTARHMFLVTLILANLCVFLGAPSVAQQDGSSATCLLTLERLEGHALDGSYAPLAKSGWPYCRQYFEKREDRLRLVGLASTLSAAEEFDAADEVLRFVIDGLPTTTEHDFYRLGLAWTTYAGVSRSREDYATASRRIGIALDFHSRAYLGAKKSRTAQFGDGYAQALSFASSISRLKLEFLKSHRYAKFATATLPALNARSDGTDISVSADILAEELQAWYLLSADLAGAPPSKRVIDRQLSYLRSPVSRRDAAKYTIDHSGLHEQNILYGQFLVLMADAQYEEARQVVDEMSQVCAQSPSVPNCNLLVSGHENALMIAEMIDHYGPYTEKFYAWNPPFGIDLSSVGAVGVMRMLWVHALHATDEEFDKALNREIKLLPPSQTNLHNALGASRVLEGVSRSVYGGEDVRALFLERVAERYPTLHGGRVHENLFLLTQGLQRVAFQQAFADLSSRTKASTMEEGYRRRLLQDLIRKLASIDTAVVAELENPATEQLERLREERFRIEDQIAGLKRQVRLSESGSAYPTLPEMRTKVLRKGEAALSINSYKEGVFLSLLTRDGVTQKFVRTDAPISNHVSKILEHIENYEYGDDRRRPFPAAEAALLYDILIRKFDTQLTDIDTLIVAPDEVFSSLPLDLLIARQGRDEASHQYLSDRFATTIIPSLTALRDLRTGTAPSRAKRPLLTFADPDIGQVKVAGSSSTLAFLSSDGASDVCELNRIPATRFISQVLAQAFGPERSVSLAGAEATEEAVFHLDRTGELSDFKVIAFNTHGLVAGELSDAALHNPALVLTPAAGCGETGKSRLPGGNGLLDTEEIAGLSLDAELVLLTACNTASGGKAGAPALTGLAEAFFYAGARRLLVSHWPAQVGATVVDRGPTEIFIKNLAEGNIEILRPKDVQRARSAVRKVYPHPAHWATFSLISAGQ